MVIFQSQNQIHVDVVRELKRNTRTTSTAPATSANSGKKVKIRTEEHYKSNPADDRWKTKYDKRMRQSQRGFYTPAHIPYACLGDVNLDVRNLVLDTLGSTQTDTAAVQVGVAYIALC